MGSKNESSKTVANRFLAANKWFWDRYWVVDRLGYAWVVLRLGFWMGGKNEDIYGVDTWTRSKILALYLHSNKTKNGSVLHHLKLR